MRCWGPAGSPAAGGGGPGRPAAGRGGGPRPGAGRQRRLPGRAQGRRRPGDLGRRPRCRHGHQSSARGLTATRGTPRSTRQRAGHRDHRHRRQRRRRGRGAAAAGRADRPGRRRSADPHDRVGGRWWPDSAHTEVYGDSAYGTGPLLASLAAGGIDHGSRSKPRSHPEGTSQGPVPDRPWRRHHDLPRTAHRPDRLQRRPGPPPPRSGQLR